MNKTEETSDSDIYNSKNNEVWLYVNPLTGRYAKVRSDVEPLAVFKDENIGRAYELSSDILKTMIGHYVPWDEMLEIANNKFDGLYELITEVS